jgi:TonB family protein
VYQSIEEETNPPADNPAPSRLWPWVVSGLFLLALTVLVGSQVRQLDRLTGDADPIRPEPEARQAYLRALGETRPALRRARLTDFLTQYPDNPRRSAAEAQLAILDAAADKDWQATLTQAYDPRLDLPTRRDAVLLYKDKWGRYLGARDEDIAALIQDIETRPIGDDAPDRTLPRDPDQYAGIPDDRLAGGPSRGFDRGRVTYRPSTRDWRGTDRQDGAVIGPRVIRNARPLYPRRAMRRGAEARVTLSLTIDERGRVSETELIGIEADGYADDFIRAAERAALQSRFEPRTIGGVPVETSGVRKRYRFELD